MKQYHSNDEQRLKSLESQADQLQYEIDEYISDAINGLIPIEKLTFAANKVFKQEGNEVPDVKGNIGYLFSQLADVNCHLWHVVEKGYDIENVPTVEKDKVVKMLAILNLERNKCIDEIDKTLKEIIENTNIKI